MEEILHSVGPSYSTKRSEETYYQPLFFPWYPPLFGIPFVISLGPYAHMIVIGPSYKTYPWISRNVKFKYVPKYVIQRFRLKPAFAYIYFVIQIYSYLLQLNINVQIERQSSNKLVTYTKSHSVLLPFLYSAIAEVIRGGKSTQRFASIYK